MDYWLDKVFPNEKDANGKIIKWLTPWCYEIRMDWSHHSALNRSSNKMYEDSYVASWGVDATYDDSGNITSEKLVSRGFEVGQEKARFIDCKASNRYNITQSIAETFEVFCQYEYKCDIRGRFVREYIDEKGQLWTGRKVVFHNRAIKTANPAIVEYKKNLDTISRTKDSSEVYTKLYVTPIESSTMDTGYISIADTALNPTLDDFILNFDYLYQTKAISQYQMNYVKTYEVETHKLNQQLINLSPFIETLTTDINNLKSKKTLAESEVSAAQSTLQQYQALRDSEIRNTAIIKGKDTAHSIIFVSDGNIRKAALHLQGIVQDSINAYSDYSCNDNNLIFSGSQLIETEDFITPTDTDYYMLVNEYGWPTYIYTSVNNKKITDNNSIIYLTLQYCPYNEYVDICDQLEWRINAQRESATILQNSIQEKETQLSIYEEQQESILEQKEELNYKLEKVLGPALREGYWTPESYEDPGESIINPSVPLSGNSGAVLIFDEEPFEGEPLNYTYVGVQEQLQDVKTYYSYIDLTDIYSGWEYKKLSELTLHLQNPFAECSAPATISGNQFLYFDGIKYYFNLRAKKGQTLKLTITTDSKPQIAVSGGIPQIGTTVEKTEAVNITGYFEGQGLYLGERLIYNNAGFIFGFLKTSTKIKPVLVLNNLNIQYNQYEKITYSFALQNRGVLKDDSNEINFIREGSSSETFCYPRIAIYDNNVNYKSDKLKLIPYKDQFTEETQALENYVDYSILVRGGRPFITLKLTDKNNFSNILSNENYHYRIEYRVSRANEMLYLDAKNVARDNSQPKYSYELKVANLPDDIGFYELGQLVYINDYSIGIHAASGYVSKIKLKLNAPQDDELEIKNYKTKFEDLFSTITASSEAMRNNQHAYNIAAGSFNSDGTISGSVLQNSILNNNISINYSNTNVEIDDINGIVLTNQQPYLNGVYGQVKLTGGGIFLSNAIDGAGARIWNTGITPNGINAAMISAGQLDVNKIRIFAGDNIAFQWNDEGIFAYKKIENGIDLNTFVRYSDRGLQFIQGERTAVDLGWNGLLISTQDGSTELSGELGLTIYDGIKRYRNNEELAYNHVVRLGKFEDGAYGLKLYKNDGNDNYIENLITTNNGELWLKDSLLVGTLEEITWFDDEGNEISGHSAAGISGSLNGDNLGSSVRFWAGQDDSHKRIAPFQVWQDGTLIANKAIITGTIYATDGEFTGTINATKGNIGNWIIEEGNLITEGIKLQAKTDTQDAAIIVGDTSGSHYVTITGDGSLTANGATINGTINASGGTIGNFEIADINTAIGSIEDITANMENVSVEISSSEGNVGKNDTTFVTTFTATVKRGGIAISESEYSKCTFFWYYQDPETGWIKINEEGILGDNTYDNYSFELKDKRYFKCEVHMEVEESGN